MYLKEMGWEAGFIWLKIGNTVLVNTVMNIRVPWKEGNYLSR
jgi:hypothetical protein